MLHIVLFSIILERRQVPPKQKLFSPYPRTLHFCDTSVDWTGMDPGEEEGHTSHRDEFFPFEPDFFLILVTTVAVITTSTIAKVF